MRYLIHSPGYIEPLLLRIDFFGAEDADQNLGHVAPLLVHCPADNFDAANAELPALVAARGMETRRQVARQRERTRRARWVGESPRVGSHVVIWLSVGAMTGTIEMTGIARSALLPILVWHDAVGLLDIGPISMPHADC
jgi:hypothetical protein